MKMIAMLIGLVVLLFLVMKLSGDFTGIQKGDGKERQLTSMQKAEDAAIKVQAHLNQQKENADRGMEK